MHAPARKCHISANPHNATHNELTDQAGYKIIL